MDKVVIHIAGRDFRPVQNSTIEHDYYMMEHVQAAGLDNCHKDPEETAEEFALRILAGLMKGGRVFPVLAGLFIPAGTEDLDWTLTVAKETEAHLRTVTDAEDKAVIHGQVVALLMNFFQLGITSLTTSRKSSGEAAGDTEIGDS